MANHAEQLDDVFRALADPTRRAVLQRLSAANGAAASELAAPFAMALPSFLQHLAVLERCGLVHSEKHGRIRTYRLSPKPLQLAERWLLDQRSAWERRLDQLDGYLAALAAAQPRRARATNERSKAPKEKKR